MNILNQWNHKWFGVWQEFGTAYQNCPSAHDFVFPEVVQTYDKRRLREYLTKAQIVASTSRNSFPHPFTGVRSEGTISFRTDGRWVWLDDLADYIDDYDIAIPPEWFREIEMNGYVPPQVSPDVFKVLEWPPIKQSSKDSVHGP